MQGREPDRYFTPEPRDVRGGDPNWDWLDLWEQENPRPDSLGEDWDYWWQERMKMSDRIWVAWSFPQFKVFDWSEDHVKILRDLIRSHVCSVCGRSDDPGCWTGC